MHYKVEYHMVNGKMFGRRLEGENINQIKDLIYSEDGEYIICTDENYQWVRIVSSQIVAIEIREL
ncbi:hypothetical protein [Priestia aryabhattai]|uniref:hypothetical protein n=1 Tax=Priestia aryabhattai TaxID=412384 RepID=UPI0032E8B2DB